MSASQIAALAGNLRAVWTAPTTDARLKKRIVRTLIHEVVADLDNAASEIVLVIHWVGGVHTELRLPKRRRGQINATPDDIVDAVRQLVLIANDDVIAGVLNRNGLTTDNGNRWTRERVTALRSYRKIPVFRSQIAGMEPWANLEKRPSCSGSRQRRYAWRPRPTRSKALTRRPMAMDPQPFKTRISGSTSNPPARPAEPATHHKIV